MTDGESYVRARWAAAAADADELRQQLDAAGRTEVLLRARVAELEEALKPFAGCVFFAGIPDDEIAFGGPMVTVGDYRRVTSVLSSGAEPGAGGGQQP